MTTATTAATTAKVHAFTAWLNFRLQLKKKDVRMKDCVNDLFFGSHWQNLTEKLIGSSFDKVGSFTGKTQVQKKDRIEWIIKELKEWNVLDETVVIKPKQVAARNSEELFRLLYYLVSNDMVFLWERMEYLQLDDVAQLSLYEFEMDPIYEENNEPQQLHRKRNLLDGMGAGGVKYENVTQQKEKIRKFRNATEMMEFKKNKETQTKEIQKNPLQCLMNFMKNHFKMSENTKMPKLEKISDLCNVKTLCLFVNCLIPHSFSHEILPNDRWSINLILRILEKIVNFESDFDATDLNSKDQIALSVYFTGLLSAMYISRQKWSVSDYEKELNYRIRYNRFEIDISGIDFNSAENKINIAKLVDEKKQLSERFNVAKCHEWKNHRHSSLKEGWKVQFDKINSIYEVVKVNKSMTTVADFCKKMFIHTKSRSPGFYKMRTAEIIQSEERKIILKNKESGAFITDNKAGKSNVRRILKLRRLIGSELDPKNYDKYDIYLEYGSASKTMTDLDEYLYQVFPDSSPVVMQDLLQQSSHTNDICTVSVLIHIFENEDISEFVNSGTGTSDTALHTAAYHGNLDIVLKLLEAGAMPNCKNQFGETPLFSAAFNSHEFVCRLLLEWGADIVTTNTRRNTVLEQCSSEQIKKLLINQSQFYSDISQKISAESDVEQLMTVVHQQRIASSVKDQPFVSVRSRCIKGSTLLHSAAHYSCLPAVKELLMIPIDVNLFDYGGCTALHRATNQDILEMLIEADALVDLSDKDGNTPLHVACYGESEKSSQIEKIAILIDKGANLIATNKSSLLPIHCAAWQGRWDVINFLFSNQQYEQIIQETLDSFKLSEKPESLMYYALFGGHVDCANKLIEAGFDLKLNEAGTLMRKIANRELVLSNNNSLESLLDVLISRGGVDINSRSLFPNDFRSILHIVSGTTSGDYPEFVKYLVDHDADVDATDAHHSTPLFEACKKNNLQSAHILLSNNANVNVKNNSGKTAFDYILDYQEWIHSGIFGDETIARLKAYYLKQVRSTIHSIDRLVNRDSEFDEGAQLRQLESRLDQCLFEDFIERSRSQIRLRAYSSMY